MRLSYLNNGSGAEVLEENNYYPFGLKHEGYNVLNGNPAYKYQYNGKELQEESGMYDYGARFYMPDLGRWGVLDPLAEKTRRWTPYVFSANNSVRFIDPDGRTWGDPNEEKRLTKNVNKRISTLQSENDKNELEINSGKLSEEKIAEKRAKMAENNTKINFMQNSLEDIKAIANAKEEFYVVAPPKGEDRHSVYKFTTAEGKMKVNIEASDTATTLHEIRHVGQAFERNGKMIFSSLSNRLINAAITSENQRYPLSRDLEIESYKIGYSYDANSGFPESVKSIEDIDEERVMGLGGGEVYKGLWGPSGKPSVKK
ncbi:RHS repeat-associated protein [Chryseobacterium sp. H1D6B]|nr:RHS repeat-associated protein [Chryseobacterium sp. H1D6B]